MLLLLFVASLLLMLLSDCLVGSACMLTASCNVDRMDDGLRGEGSIEESHQKGQEGHSYIVV